MPRISESVIVGVLGALVVVVGRLFLDDDRHVLDQAREPLGQRVERLAHGPLEVGTGQRRHADEPLAA